MSHKPDTTDTQTTASLITRSRHIIEERSWNYPAELFNWLSEDDPEALLAKYAANLQDLTAGRPRRTEVNLTVQDPDHGNVGLHFAVDTFRIVHYVSPVHWVFAGRATGDSDNRVELHFVNGKASLAVLIAQDGLPETTE